MITITIKLTCVNGIMDAVIGIGTVIGSIIRNIEPFADNYPRPEQLETGVTQTFFNPASLQFFSSYTKIERITIQVNTGRYYLQPSQINISNSIQRILLQITSYLWMKIMIYTSMVVVKGIITSGDRFLER